MRYCLTIHLTGLLLSVVLSFHTQAQTSLSSLKKQLATAQADTSRTRLLYELGVQYEEIDHDSSVYFFRQSLQIAQRVQHLQATASALFRLGYMHLYYLSDPSHALKWLNQGLAIARKNNDVLNQARCYQYLAVIAYNQHIGNTEELLQQALANAKKAGDWQVITNTYLIMNIIHKKTDIKRAEQDCLQAMAACEQHDRWSWLSQGLAYCDILDEQGKYEQSLAFARKMGVIAHILKGAEGDYNRMNSLASIETRLDNYPAANRIFRAVLTHERAKSKPDTFRLVNTYVHLLDLYEKQGDYKAAYTLNKDMLEMRTRLREASITKETQVEMTKLKAAWDLEKKETEINHLVTQQRQQRLLLMVAVLAALLLIGFVIILRRSQQRTQRQKAELSQLNTTKDKLFAILSHDLRSPVANLENNVMLTKWGALSQDEFIESTQSLGRDIRYVRTMLDNVLHWSVSQMGGMQPRAERLDLQNLVEEQIQVLFPVAAVKAIQIINQIPAEVQLRVDKNHLALIIRNLLQNAIKFTYAGGIVCFRYSETPHASAIMIEDTGIGMKKSQLDTLFRLGISSSRLGTAQEQGTGLGLVLVDELIKSNGGQIDVVSREGKGTTFTLTFFQKSENGPKSHQITPFYA